MSHGSGKFIGNHYYHNSMKEVLGGYLDHRSDDIKQYKNSDQKWKKNVIHHYQEVRLAS